MSMITINNCKNIKSIVYVYIFNIYLNLYPYIMYKMLLL